MMMGHGVVLCVMMMAMLIGSKRGGELVASIGEVLKPLVSYLLCRVVEKEEGRRFGGCLSGWPCPILMNVRGLCCETLLHVSSTCPPRVLCGRCAAGSMGAPSLVKVCKPRHSFRLISKVVPSTRTLLPAPRHLCCYDKNFRLAWRANAASPAIAAERPTSWSSLLATAMVCSE
jgi:hypothetical protein